MIKVIVFDLGGTLMEYEGMPHSWISYYRECFNFVNDRYTLNLNDNELELSCRILKEYNPRYKPREIEYSSEFLFAEATKHWNTDVSIENIITSFFSSMNLIAKIYDDTIPVVNSLRNKGCKISALTNLPSSMPDRIFRNDITQIINILDLYVSSEICGYRKPNKAGLEYIAKYFDVNINELIFVGDEELDISTAKNAGCKSILICRNGKNEYYNEDACIESLLDLLSLDILNV